MGLFQNLTVVLRHFTLEVGEHTDQSAACPLYSPTHQQAMGVTRDTSNPLAGTSGTKKEPLVSTCSSHFSESHHRIN